MGNSSTSRRNFLAGSAAGAAALAAGPISAATGRGVEDRRFADRVVLITGGTSGIGEAAARAFAAEGAEVFFCGRREDRGREVAASIQENGGSATFFQADVREEGEVEAFVSACVERAGTVHIAFNNAGIEGPEGSLAEIDVDGEMGYRDVMRTNLDGVYHAMRHELPVMIEQGEGVIVNTVSVLGSGGSDGWGAYSASKHAVLGLTRSAALAHAGDGLRIVSLSPGSTDTELLRRMYDDDLSESAEANPMGRVAEPEEMAAMVLKLASPEATFLNGEDIKVDGGSSA